MFSQSDKTDKFADIPVGTSTGGQQSECATIYGGDIRQPWKSVYGFSMTAARLAVGEQMVLSCREDEVFDYLAQLNELLESPESLSRAYGLLVKLAQATRQKFERLLQLRDEPLSEEYLPALLAEVEELLAGPNEQTVADRLACLLSPNEPAQEIVGLGKMLARLRRVMVGLERVKDCGFKVTVIGRQRQPLRPNLEARRNEAIPGAGQSGHVPAGFVLPMQYHRTLWNYRVVKYEGGQLVAWN